MTNNILKPLGSIVLGYVVLVEFYNDAPKLWNISMDHLSERGVIELYKRNLLKGIHNCKIELCKYYWETMMCLF